MALYFLQCELRSSRDYQGLYDYLDELDAVRLLDSLWCFHRVHTGAAGLRELFKQYVGPGDSLVVIEAQNWAISNAISTPNSLQRERVRPIPLKLPHQTTQS